MSGARGPSRVATNGRVPVVAGGGRGCWAAGRRDTHNKGSEAGRRGAAPRRLPAGRGGQKTQGPESRRSPLPGRRDRCEGPRLSPWMACRLGAGPGRTCQVSAPPVPLAY